MSDLQDLYKRSAGAVRADFAGDGERAAAYYRAYADFVRGVAPPSAGDTLLDVGCGSGWSAYLFARQGYRVTGVDLNPDAFEAPSSTDLTLRAASAMDLPFA